MPKTHGTPHSPLQPAWEATGLELTIPKRLTLPDAWVGHLPFAFWLIEHFQPRLLVELGVHTGNSYCSFCEAVDRLSLSTQCAGVDHWMGDPQAGYYGDEIYDELKGHHDPLYQRFSKLMRMGFDDATSFFEDASVDLLHIDGFHTYEAVSHDFKTWRRKLSDRSIVLFHDTNVHDRNFGVWRFFAELEEEFPSFNFLHSNGLGVVYTGRGEVPEALRSFFSKALESQNDIRAYFSRLGSNLLSQLTLKALSDRTKQLSASHIKAERLTGQLNLEVEKNKVLQNKIEGLDYELSQAVIQKNISVQTKRETDQHYASAFAEIRKKVQTINATYHQNMDLFLQNNELNLSKLKEADTLISRYSDTEQKVDALIKEVVGFSGADFLGRIAAINHPQSRRRKTLEFAVQKILGNIQASPFELPTNIPFELPLKTAFEPIPLPSEVQNWQPIVDDVLLSQIEGLGEDENRYIEMGLFDPKFYEGTTEAHAQGLTPLQHYLTIGEDKGLAPSPAFDPVFYGQRYPDIAASGYGLLRHYVDFGQAEGRECLSRTSRLKLDVIAKTDRPSVLVVLERLTPSPANNAALQFIKEAAQSYDVVVFSNSDGEWSRQFSDLSRGVYILPGTGPKLPGENQHLATKITQTLNPDVAIVFDKENHDLGRQISSLGCAVVSYIHDETFHLHDIYDDILCWSDRTGVSSRTLKNKIAQVYPRIEAFGEIEIIHPPADPFPPLPPVGTDTICDAIRSYLKPPGMGEAMIVAVDGSAIYFSLLIAIATELRAKGHARAIRFVWLGDQAILDQSRGDIEKAGLESQIVTQVIAPYYQIVLQSAEAALVLPGLGTAPLHYLQAMRTGLPILSISDHDELSEWLTEDETTQQNVLPYLDYRKAVEWLQHLIADRSQLLSLRASTRAAADVRFTPNRMAQALRRMCDEARERRATVNASAHEIAQSSRFDEELYRAPSADEEPRSVAIMRYCMEASVTGSHQNDKMPQRRPSSGFNPNVYAHHLRETGQSEHTNPLAQFLRNGEPAGAWSHQVLTPLELRSEPSTGLKIAIHGHFYYPDLIDEFLEHLSHQTTAFDLFLTCNSNDAADRLHSSVLERRHWKVSVGVVPNKGRDVGPFLSFLQGSEANEYDIVGHFHGKKSDHLDSRHGASWRSFLWETLLGSHHRMADQIISAFASQQELGLVFPEEPYLFGWADNKKNAEAIASRLGIDVPLPDSFDFPVGTMFWARREALQPLNELKLTWEDYPIEPVGNDGTVMHAIERIIPFVVQKQGFTIATTRVPGVMR